MDSRWRGGANSDVLVQTGANLHYEGLTPAAAMMQSDMRSHVQFSASRNASTFIASANKLSDWQYCTVHSIRPVRCMVEWRQTFTQT